MTLNFRFGGYQGENSVHTRALRRLAAALERRLSGAARVLVTANVAEQGYKAADLLKLVAEGAFDICYFQSSYLDTAKVPALRALDLPFLLTDRGTIYERLDGAFGAHLAQAVADALPYRVLAFWDNGFRHISNAVRPIRAPRDCTGLRMRTTASPLHQRIFAAFGFSPIAVDPADLPAAVAAGRVDAQENPLTNFVNFGIHRHHMHLTLTSHFFGCAPLLVNRARYDALPRDLQEALRSAAAEATEAQRAFAQAEDAQCRAVIDAAGVGILEAEEVDLAAFRAAAAPVVAHEKHAIGQSVMALLDA
ncbi:MAG TPA: TRAP transporter substrate-binding protein [Xanthobacteraceae bacterium]|nr:TRAP transporter substrate-binding protein [Xanthobacteraceae bacterium]